MTGMRSFVTFGATTVIKPMPPKVCKFTSRLLTDCLLIVVFRFFFIQTFPSFCSISDFNITFGIAERKLGGWITQEDLRDAAINIVKLCEMYDLDVRDVFDGYIQDHVVTPLLAEELYFIAATADKQDRMRSAVVWFEELYRRVSEDMYTESTLKLITVARVLAGVYNKVCQKLS